MGDAMLRTSYSQILQLRSPPTSPDRPGATSMDDLSRKRSTSDPRRRDAMGSTGNPRVHFRSRASATATLFRAERPVPRQRPPAGRDRVRTGLRQWRPTRVLVDHRVRTRATSAAQPMAGTTPSRHRKSGRRVSALLHCASTTPARRAKTVLRTSGDRRPPSASTSVVTSPP